MKPHLLQSLGNAAAAGTDTSDIHINLHLAATAHHKKPTMMAPLHHNNNVISQHQEIRVLSVDDTIQTLTRLENRLKEVKETAKRRVKSVDSLSLTLAFVDNKSTPQHDESIVQMCRAVARCFPKLKTLEVCSEMDNADVPHPNRVPLPVQSLTALLHPYKGLKKLRELTLDGIRFQADEERMRVLVKAISKHDALQTCRFFDTSMSTLSSGRSGMEKFVSALAKKIEKLVLRGCPLAAPEMMETGGSPCLWAGSCLVKLCRSTTLKEVKIHSIQELREEHIVLMSQELATNTHLKKLSLLKYQQQGSSDATAKKKKKKKKKPKKEMEEEETLSSDAGTLALANMLKENTVLEELCLSSFDFNEYSAMFLGNALQQDNTTLLDLWLMVPNDGGGTSSFPVDDPRVDYYLRLNRAGRNRVVQLIQDQQAKDGSTTSTRSASLEQTSLEERKAWINTLINSKRDTDASFYLLQSIPALCDLERLRLPPSA